MRLIYKQICRLIMGLSFIVSAQLVTSSFVLAEQYPTGSHSINSGLGTLNINVGYVSHFNANDFYVYSFQFQPTGSQQWHQVPYVDKEDSPKMAFTLLTKHSADTLYVDAKLVATQHSIHLLIASKALVPGSIDGGITTVTHYELSKAEDYERWVFVWKNSRKIESKLCIEKVLEAESAAILHNPL